MTMIMLFRPWLRAGAIAALLLAAGPASAADSPTSAPALSQWLHKTLDTPGTDKPPPPPPEVWWQDPDSLVPYDRNVMEQVLVPMWGADPSLWPDWLEPRIAMLPGSEGAVMVVREPLRAPCGDYAFVVFSPYRPPQGYRQQLGAPLCADGLEVQPQRRHAIPDLILKGTTMPAGDGLEHRDQHLHWTGDAWVEIGDKATARR